MCEEVEEGGGFYQSGLEAAVCCGAPASLVPSMGRMHPIHSAQLEGSVQPDSEVSLEFGHHAPYSLFLLKSEGLGRLLSSQNSQGIQEGDGAFSFLQSRDYGFATRDFGCKETKLCPHPFLICPGVLPKFSSTLSSS